MSNMSGTTTAQSSDNRGFNCGDVETRCLVQIWSEETIQMQLTGAIRNKKVWDTVSQKMTEHGYNKTGVMCRVRVKNLKHTYKRVKDHNNISGNAPKTCKFFEELDRVLGTRPSTRPTTVLDSSTSASDIFDEESDVEDEQDGFGITMEPDESPVSDEPRPITPVTTATPKGRKRSRADICQKMIDSSMEKFIQFQKEQETNMLLMEEKRMKMEEEAEKRREEREDRRRQEDRDHELRIIQLLAGSYNQNPNYQSYQPSYHNI